MRISRVIKTDHWRSDPLHSAFCRVPIKFASIQLRKKVFAAIHRNVCLCVSACVYILVCKMVILSHVSVLLDSQM